MDKIIKFEASWCQPCKRLAEELKDVNFPIEALDVEENPDLTDAHAVKGVPTLIFLKGGQEVDRLVGFVSKEKVAELIKKTYGTELSN